MLYRLHGGFHSPLECDVLKGFREIRVGAGLVLVALLKGPWDLVIWAYK